MSCRSINDQLFIAAENGDIEASIILIKENADINAYHACGATPLYIAAQQGHINFVEFCLNSGADINAQSTADKLTPLYTAVQNHQTDVVKLLLERGAKTEIPRAGGSTALFCAVYLSDKLSVDFLLQYKARIDVSVNGVSILEMAKQKGCVEILTLLIAVILDS